MIYNCISGIYAIDAKIEWLLYFFSLFIYFIVFYMTILSCFNVPDIWVRTDCFIISMILLNNYYW